MYPGFKATLLTCWECQSIAPVDVEKTSQMQAPGGGVGDEEGEGADLERTGRTLFVLFCWN